MSSRILKSIPFMLTMCAGVAPAMGADFWIADETRAFITLPDPEPGSPVTGGTMSCSEQAWTMTLTLEMGALVAGATGTAVFATYFGSVEARSELVSGAIEIGIPHELLEPLMRSSRVGISFVGGSDEIRLPLKGSRKAITVASRLCSRRVMPVANSIPLTPFSSYLMLARQLRASDIDDFALSTATEPKIRAGMVEIGAGRRLLFTELCGSTWYYGRSGCNLTGYAPVEGQDPATPEGWRIVYETEGVFLYTDPAASHDGWPDLIAYSMLDTNEQLRWVWDGGEYRLAGDVAQAAEDQ